MDNKIKILVIHNQYLEKGGEDFVVEAEANMLRKHGHEVILYQRQNSEINILSFFQKILFCLRTIFWSSQTYNEVRDILKKEKPNVVHVHNTFFMVSPSIYDACFDEKIPVVQTLHNYRFSCINGLFFRDNQICQKCLKGSGLAAVVHKCWHNSYFLSAIMSLLVKKIKKIYQDSSKISKFIVLSEFSERILKEFGIAKQRIVLKPNFVDISLKNRKDFDDYVVFVGRLVDYKGIVPLIDVFCNLPDNRLKIIGDGPLKDLVEEKIRGFRNIEYLGRLSNEESLGIIKRASFLIYPSKCFETFGRVVVEAFACGVPVLVSEAGASSELVVDGQTGFHLNPYDLQDMKEKILKLLKDKTLLIEMGSKAKKAYETTYAIEENYNQLLSLYKKVVIE